MKYLNAQFSLPGTDADRNLKSLSRHALLGVGVIAALVLGLGGWSATTQVDGAVIANGVVVAEGGSRRVQHQEGGIVREILVRNNQHVEAGQVLIRLDDVALRAELEVVRGQLREGIATQARLVAESTGDTLLLLPDIAAQLPPDPELMVVLDDQQRLRQSRKVSLDNAVERLDQLIAEKGAMIEGYKAQLLAYGEQKGVLEEELTQLSALFEQSLVSNERLNETRRNAAELSGTMASVEASITATQSAITELRMQAEQLGSDFRAEALAQLQTVSQTVAELMQRKIAAEARLARLEIRAPIAGTVHQSIVQTIGGVISPADTLMLIVPQEDHLVADMRVSPMEINKLSVGQTADIRLLNFDARTTPDLTGSVNTISPDLVQDAATGVAYYSVRVDIAESEMGKLPAGAALVPGMPVESFFQTGERTVWSYLMAPIQERFSRAFRED